MIPKSKAEYVTNLLQSCPPEDFWLAFTHDIKAEIYSIQTVADFITIETGATHDKMDRSARDSILTMCDVIGQRTNRILFMLEGAIE